MDSAPLELEDEGHANVVCGDWCSTESCYAYTFCRYQVSRANHVLRYKQKRRAAAEKKTYPLGPSSGRSSAVLGRDFEHALSTYSSCAQVYVRTLNGKGKIIDSLRLIVLAL